MSSGFVVALVPDSDVISFPNVPDAAGLMNLMRAQTAGAGPRPTTYLEAGDGRVVGFTADRAKAQVFSTEAEAQAAIGRIPTMVRPAGLKVQPA